MDKKLNEVKEAAAKKDDDEWNNHDQVLQYANYLRFNFDKFKIIILLI